MKWKSFFVLLIIIAVVCAEENSLARKRKKNKHGFFPGYLYKSGIWAYVAFIAIKVKIIVAIAIFTAAMAFGMKALAAVKYAKTIFGNCGHHDGLVFSHPTGVEHEYISDGSVVYSSYPGPPEDSYGPPKMPHTESSYDKYARNLDEDIEDDWNKSLKRIIKRMDITEYAFDSMNMQNEKCKRKFVCEIDQISRRNTLLGFGLQFFSDQGLNKYRNGTIHAKSLQECSQIYTDCPT